MATDDWIPMRADLYGHISVAVIADTLGMDQFAVIGRLHYVWVWAKKNLDNGIAKNLTPEWIDRYLATPGFAAAMLKAGWLRVRSGGVEFPHFDRWISEAAQCRVAKSGRKRAERSRSCRDPVAEMSHKLCDKLATPGIQGETTETAETLEIPASKEGGVGGGVSFPETSPKREEEKPREEPPKPPAAVAVIPPPPVDDKPARRNRPKQLADDLPIPPALDTPEFRDAWAEWLAYRREDKREPVTARAAAKQFSAMIPIGPARAVECIQKSIANDWKGIFPDQAGGRAATKAEAVDEYARQNFQAIFPQGVFDGGPETDDRPAIAGDP